MPTLRMTRRPFSAMEREKKALMITMNRHAPKTKAHVKAMMRLVLVVDYEERALKALQRRQREQELAHAHNQIINMGKAANKEIDRMENKYLSSTDMNPRQRKWATMTFSLSVKPVLAKFDNDTTEVIEAIKKHIPRS